MTASDRIERTQAADGLCAGAFEKVGGPDVGVSLVAVGGYGRGELAPGSDLDLVLVHEDGMALGQVAEDLWYPIWDSGTKLDHSVRSLPEMVEQARLDLKVALGLLDVRHVAGDPNLTLRLRTTVLTSWRRDARSRLPELRELVRARHERVGELAHLSVPDLKEAVGGLRDATVLRALVSSWLVDVPHVELATCRTELLDVRDALHEVSGRGSDRIAPELWGDLADRLKLEGEGEAQRRVRELGRRVTHLSRLTWRRVGAVLARPVGRSTRKPDLTRIAEGLALSGGEVVLHSRARPDQDPLLLLRAAAEAAERGAALAPATAARLAREKTPLPEPWPAGARQLLVRLLAAGPGLLEVWETLEETAALDRILPEWQRIRLLPHASPIHRFTVDRHVIETCVEAAALIRRVSRPDLLLAAAMLHDIGKGGPVEHSRTGEPIARVIASRLGFEARAVEVIGRLVRWHLLLAETATTRDPEDPATVASVREALGDAESVSLLRALTEADARATSPKAWTAWRAGLVEDLTCRVLATFDDQTAVADVPPALALPARGADGIGLAVEANDDGSRVVVVAADRVGLLADVAAALALQRAPVRAARAWTEGESAVSVWSIADVPVDPARLRERFAAVVAGRVDPAVRLAGRASTSPAPAVVVRPEASRRSTVLEVRAADQPGVLHLTLAALAALEITVCSAHIDTLGPQAVDVFYLQETGAGALSETRAAEAAHAVRSALDDL